MTKDTFSNQLKKIYTQEKPKMENAAPYQEISFKLPHPSAWVEDGVDHINISPAALTDLGRTLHPNTALAFNHDVFGDFSSVSSFWDFIETGAKHDKLRSLKTNERMRFMRNISKLHVNSLKFFILDAIWIRIKTYVRLSECFKESTLPFDSYYLNGEHKFPVRREGMFWMIRGFEDMRLALKNGCEPDFSFFKDGYTRKELFENYFSEHVRPAVNIDGKNKAEENVLLKELQSSQEAPRAFRRKIRPIVTRLQISSVEVEIEENEENVKDPTKGEEEFCSSRLPEISLEPVLPELMSTPVTLSDILVEKQPEPLTNEVTP